MNEAQNISAKIIKIVAKALRLTESEINYKASSDSIDGWDSLAHLNLISSLEEEFKIHFTTEEIINMKSIPQISNVINIKINNSN